MSYLLGEFLSGAGIPFVSASAIHRNGTLTVTKLLLREEKDVVRALVAIAEAFPDFNVGGAGIRAATPEEIAESDRWDE